MVRRMTVASLRWVFVAIVIACGWIARFVASPTQTVVFYYALANVVLAALALYAAIRLPALLAKHPGRLIAIAVSFAVTNFAYVAARVARRPPGSPFTNEDVEWVGITLLMLIVLIVNIRHLAASGGSRSET
jgi:hypothetical protein